VGPVVFAGTAAFAVPTLQRLHEAGYSISGVVTQPDKPGGRGQTVQAPPVKQKALELQLPVFQPLTLKNEQARELFRELNPDLIVVVAYGKILPKWLVELPRFGVVNLHGSLLPKYRGAAPIQWSIARGETETGVCTMKIDEGLDTGPVYLCEKTLIGADETAPQLSQRLAAIGSELAKKTLDGIFAGTLLASPQDHDQATYAPILKKEDGYIDWNLPANAIHNRIRGFKPWPGSVTRFRDNSCKVLTARVAPTREGSSGSMEAGTIVAGKGSLGAVCGDGGILELLEIQLPNRRPLSGADFVNGAHLVTGEKFQAVTDN
jgi:methionyl-tRNA formyltransferase